MYREIDIENWERKEHYHFFKTFEEPFFGVCVKLDITKLVAKCKQNKESLFLKYLHCASLAINSIDNLRLRIKGDKVVLFDVINVSATIAREDKTFGFSIIPHKEDFNDFRAFAQKEIESIRASSGLNLSKEGADLVHYSTMPWLDFTSVSHARSFSREDSCPKVTFGKITKIGGKFLMPVSVHAHHALADGFHVGQFVKELQVFLEN